jgi:hypothetical protein
MFKVKDFTVTPRQDITETDYCGEDETTSTSSTTATTCVVGRHARRDDDRAAQKIVARARAPKQHPRSRSP